MSNIVLYPEELVPGILYFQWPSRKNMQRLYQKLLKIYNGDQKYLKCQDLQEINSEVLCSAIALDKFYLECEDTVKSKHAVNDSCFITY